MFVRFAVAFLFLATLLRAAEIRGKVTNVDGGEPLGRVQVVVVETKAAAETIDDGTFVIRDLPPGSYTLRFNAVAYRLLTVPFTLLGADDIKEFDISLAPDNFHRTDKVEVHGDES